MAERRTLLGWYRCLECEKAFGHTPYGGQFCSGTCCNNYMKRKIENGD
ncbi:hypothetical protein LCGC14_1642250 [marine sediment metagenome]|uniref:Uncharacterized protein n=1 Tax=marine sediment metagenome TaxID=412755 RepID=A0A0F9HZY0_9ZZZZ